MSETDLKHLSLSVIILVDPDCVAAEHHNYIIHAYDIFLLIYSRPAYASIYQAECFSVRVITFGPHTM